MPDILVWNDDYDMLPAGVDDCPGEFRLIDDRLRIAEAEAVIFHVPTLRDPIETVWKPPGQRWVAWSMESDANYPLLADPGFMSNFDLTMTYRRDADVWVPYLDAGLVGLVDGTIGASPDSEAPRRARHDHISGRGVHRVEPRRPQRSRHLRA